MSERTRLMPEIFVRCSPDTALRFWLAMAVVARCRMFGGATVAVIESDGPLRFIGDEWLELVSVRIPLDGFARRSREVADSMATGPYCLVDDDHLPIGKGWLDYGLEALAAHPGYAMLSSWSINGEVPEGPRKIGDLGSGVYGDNGIFDVPSCGTPCFVRPGTFVALPDGEASSYDTTLSEWLRGRGRIGFMRDARHNHLGYGYSQVVPGHWGA